MNQSYLTHTRITLILGGIIVVAAVLIMFVVLPLISGIKETHNTIRKTKEEFAHLDSEIKSYKKLSSEFAKISAERQALAVMFPKREEMVVLVEGVESAVNQARVTSRVTITDKKETKMSSAEEKNINPVLLVAGLQKIEEVSYALELSGDYRQIVDFLLYLEHLPFISEIVKFTITADTVQNETAKTLRNSGNGTSLIEGIFFIKQQ